MKTNQNKKKEACSDCKQKFKDGFALLYHDCPTPSDWIWNEQTYAERRESQE